MAYNILLTTVTFQAHGVTKYGKQLSNIQYPEITRSNILRKISKS